MFSAMIWNSSDLMDSNDVEEFSVNIWAGSLSLLAHLRNGDEELDPKSASLKWEWYPHL